MHLITKAREVIEEVIYITIATISKDGQPWNTPVYAVHDEKYNFFWSSWMKANHSTNIRENSNVFIVIYDSTRPRGKNYLKGVYIKAKAYELEEEKEIEYALKYFFGIGGEKLEVKDFTGNSQKRIYKAVPEKVWLNEVSESQVTKDTKEMRVEVKGFINGSS